MDILFAPVCRDIVRGVTDPVQRSLERTIETQTHGRYLVSPGSGPGAPLLLGFHGYAETAEEQMRRLRAIPGTGSWLTACVQGLHHFYRRRTDEVVASWMTRQNRELAIADNLAYVSAVVRRIREDFSGGSAIVASGFSQGAAMAYRIAAAVDGPAVAVIACGGDVPPELDMKSLGRFRAALIGRGVRDPWYTAEKMGSDEERLRKAGVPVEVVLLDAAHEWTPEFGSASSRFLQSFLAGSWTL